MSKLTKWAFPEDLQPRQDGLAFSLQVAYDSMVLLRAEVPEDAFTAQILGTERSGNGVVIAEDGLVLTIGYLITEAESIWLTTNDGKVVPGYPLAYDQVTGFGLVLPLGKLGVPMLGRGSAKSLHEGDEAIVIGHGGGAHGLTARVVSKREFVGYWEYVLDEALFVAPAHPEWAGTALLGPDGRLAGIGSLLVQESFDGEDLQCNMFVPIDLLEPILDDMRKLGRPAGHPRPWLGMYLSEEQGDLVVMGMANGGPADSAGVQVGDAVLGVAGESPSGLADLFRRIWRLGPAGTAVPLVLSREGEKVSVQVKSADRNDYLKKPQVH
jgi:S1-C subfamily serine protease